MSTTTQERLTLPYEKYFEEVSGTLGFDLTRGEAELVTEAHRRGLPSIFAARHIRESRGLPVV